MGMSTAMEDVLYGKKNFAFSPDANERRPNPSFFTEKWYIYHLREDEEGNLQVVTDSQGLAMKSPRRLSEISIYSLVVETNVLVKTRGYHVPNNIYPIMLSEAIFQREPSAIQWLISTWPFPTLHMYDVIPEEDYLEEEYLTTVMENHVNTSVIDCVIAGLLKIRQTESRLRHIDFQGFEKDRKLCRELSRLPILWMRPNQRTAEQIHDILSRTLDISLDKTQRYLNRIDVVYSNIDDDIHHGNKMDNTNIILDLKLHLDDIPIGLSLQSCSPFVFKCRRLWVKPIAEVGFDLGDISKVLDPNLITHFEYEDPELPLEDSKIESLITALGSMHCLTALSLPGSVDVIQNPYMASHLNSVFIKLKYLQKLNFSYCNLSGGLSTLLGRMRRPVTYLNFRDCRLTGEDLVFLMNWRPLVGIRELNLSCNNISVYENLLFGLIRRMSHITCLSVACCSLSTHTLVLLVREVKEHTKVRLLSLVGYIPLPQNDILELLHACAQIRSLQKVMVFPEAYAFPGINEEEREFNKYHAVILGYRYLKMRGRQEVEIV